MTGPMKRFLKTLEYFFDYTFTYMMFSPRKIHVYHKYMFKKWGERYCTKEEYDEYFRNFRNEL